MKRFITVLFRLCWWLLTIIVSVLTAWLVNRWLEPQPLWSIPSADPVQFVHYHQAQERLCGWRPDENNNQQLVVYDARTGNELATCNAPSTDSNHTSAQAIDSNPRLVGDSVYRFIEVQTLQANKEVQLRRWRYRDHQQEETIARWNFDTHSVPGSSNPFCNLQTVWSPRHPGLCLVYRYFPSDQILHSFSNASQPVLSTPATLNWQHWHASLWVCEVWQWDETTSSMKRVYVYPSSIFHRATKLAHYWSADGTHFGQVPGWSTKTPASVWVEALTGKLHSYSPFEEDKRWYGMDAANELIMLQRHVTVEQLDQGRPQNILTRFPIKGKLPEWSLNDWRPLLDANTLQPLTWPATLDHKIVGDDHLTRDHAHPHRYLYHSSIWDESPYYRQFNTNGSQVSCFAILRYKQGKLTVESSWYNAAIANCNNALLCGQLFVEGSEMPDLPYWLNQLLTQSTWLYSKYAKYKQFNARYVCILTPENNTVYWKRLHFSLDPLVPVLGSDRLLLRQSRNLGSAMMGYECWQLPIPIHFRWWGRLAGMVIFLYLALALLRKREENTLSK